jgi:hypothetical protein
VTRLIALVGCVLVVSACGAGTEPNAQDTEQATTEPLVATAGETVTTSEDGLETPEGASVSASFVEGKVYIPLTTTGEYSWTSEPIVLDHSPDSFVTAYRVNGAATVTDFRARISDDEGATTVSITFSVGSVDGPAELVLLGSEGRDFDDE